MHKAGERKVWHRSYVERVDICVDFHSVLFLDKQIGTQASTKFWNGAPPSLRVTASPQKDQTTNTTLQGRDGICRYRPQMKYLGSWMLLFHVVVDQLLVDRVAASYPQSSNGLWVTILQKRLTMVLESAGMQKKAWSYIRRLWPT